MALDPPGKVLISHNIETFVIMESLDLDTYQTVNINVQFFRYFNISTTNLVFKPILVITLTVITAWFSEYKYSEAVYSSGSDVSVHCSSHSTQRQRKTVLIQFPQNID